MEHLVTWSLITAAVSVALALARDHALQPVRAEAVDVRSAPVRWRSCFHGPS